MSFNNGTAETERTMRMIAGFVIVVVLIAIFLWWLGVTPQTIGYRVQDVMAYVRRNATGFYGFSAIAAIFAYFPRWSGVVFLAALVVLLTFVSTTMVT